jgi:hypothetical protein
VPRRQLRAAKHPQRGALGGQGGRSQVTRMR